MNVAHRRVLPELLDDLPPENPRAIASRRDLRRLNVVLRHAGAMVRALEGRRLPRILEIGAGDGAFACRILRPLAARAEISRVTLLDRKAVVGRDYLEALPSGLRATRVTADVFDYLADPAIGRFDAIVANLFLHHFPNEDLERLLALVAGRTDLFVACEPRRARRALVGCRFLPVIGCNDVTRHDARVSVLAGFVGRELSDLWPDPDAWRLAERGFPPFGHLFRAERGR